MRSATTDTTSAGAIPLPRRLKLASVPREEGEDLIRTTIWLTESDKAWLEARAGVSQTVRKLIRNAREICEQVSEPAREPQEPLI